MVTSLVQNQKFKWKITHTGCITVHAEAVPPHIPYGLNGHGVTLAAQPRLRETREGDASAGRDDGSSKKRWTSAAGLNSQTLRREELFFSLGSLGEKLRQRKYEYENEAAAPLHADTSRALPLMSVSSNKRHPTLRCTCLTTTHMWQLEVGEEEWED